mmetsp:Transcript_1736/g.10713  ORF Transcript_1736/g.10713 Transcript_1736/m.10713 type:complete len:97 (-) Transcript_1736:2287-2577(-)
MGTVTQFYCIAYVTGSFLLSTNRKCGGTWKVLTCFKPTTGSQLLPVLVNRCLSSCSERLENNEAIYLDKTGSLRIALVKSESTHKEALQNIQTSVT